MKVASMSIRQELELLALLSLGEQGCPDPNELAAYIVGTLTGNAHLRVAAHVRHCPVCQEDMHLARPPASRRRSLLAQLLPVFATGVRSTTTQHLVRQYRAADLTIMLTIVPLVNDVWRLTGQLLRQEQPVIEQPLILRSGRKRGYRQSSDAQGFFSFDDIPAGVYTLTVEYEQTLVQIRGLILSHDELSEL